jgi:predicted RNA methylase
VTERMDTWMAALEKRQLADLTFAEVSRSLRALSSTYVERRARLKEGAALSGAGKRAAFALFYGPLHFLLVHHIVASLGQPFTTIETLLDLGCGTGAAGAGWATACVSAPRLSGIDRHPWAIEEARRCVTDLGLRATLRVDDLTHVALDESGVTRNARQRSARAAPHGAPGARRRGDRRRSGVLLAFAVNELTDASERTTLLSRLVEHGRAGGQVLVVEPLAGFVAPWWKDWQREFEAIGGRADEWRFRVPLPPIIEKLDRAAGLDHRELKGRSLSV